MSTTTTKRGDGGRGAGEGGGASGGRGGGRDGGVGGGERSLCDHVKTSQRGPLCVHVCVEEGGGRLRTKISGISLNLRVIAI